VNVVYFLLGDSQVSEFYVPKCWYILVHTCTYIHTYIQFNFINPGKPLGFGYETCPQDLTNSIRRTKTVSSVHKQYQAYTDSIKRTQTVSSVHKQYQAYTDSIKRTQTVSSIHKQYQAYTNSIKRTQTVSSIHKQYQAYTDSIKRTQNKTYKHINFKILKLRYYM
jgi:hypothetical protein